MAKLEKTKYPGIQYDRETDRYIVSLDFGRVPTLDPKTGEMVQKQKKTRRSCRTLAEARRIKDDHDRLKRDGKLTGKQSKVTVHEAIEDYITNRTTRKKDPWSQSYTERQQIHQRRVEDYLTLKGLSTKPIRTFSIHDLETFFDWCTAEHKFAIPVVQKDGTVKNENRKYEALSYNTVDKLRSFLKGLNKFMLKDFDKYGVEKEIVSLTEVSAQKTHFVPEVLNAEQVNDLIRYALDFEVSAHAGAPLTNLVLGCLCGGMRRGEQLGVKWCDLELPTEGENNGRVHVLHQRIRGKGGTYEKTPKGGKDDGETPEERKERWAPLPRSAWTLLQIVREEQSKYREVKDTDYIYQEPVHLIGNYLSDPNRIDRRFKEFQNRYNRNRKKSGLEEIPHVRLHDLRHTYANLLAHFDAEAHPEIGKIDHDIISYSMGHTTKGTTVTERVYLHDNGVRTKLNKALDICVTTDLRRHDVNNLPKKTDTKTEKKVKRSMIRRKYPKQHQGIDFGKIINDFLNF